MKKEILLVLAGSLLAILLFEGVARFFVQPSDDFYGVFLGKKLLPEKINYRDRSAKMKRWYRGLVVDGRKVIHNDIVGIYRPDDLLGAAPLEKAASVNAWWQTNSLGALHRGEVTKEVAPGVRRVLAFGESFTQCQGVPLEDSWPFHLEKTAQGLEVLNFGVGGYSMCQAYLRYKTLAGKVDHNVVLLGFVPSPDLARDVNVYRGFLGMAGPIMPRFEIEGEGLKLIASPYKNLEGFIEDNQRGFSDKLKIHLRAHDRFYFLHRYEALPVMRDSILLKWFALIQRRKMKERLMEPGSEAIRVSKRIFEEMNKDVRRSGAEFILMIVPSAGDLIEYKKSAAFRARWDRMVPAVTGTSIKHIDLMRGMLQNIPGGQIDMAYDGAHYGPRANRLAAQLIADELTRSHIV